MTMEEFTLIARCNGSFTDAYRPDINEEESDRDMLNMFTNGYNDNSEIYENKFSVIHHDPNNSECKSSLELEVKKGNYNFFKTCVFASTRRENFYIVATTSRKVLGQTGDGHFSPIAALNIKDENLLLLDAARFKYNSMWFKIKDVFDSFKPIDKTTEKSRGFLLCSRYH